MGFKSSVAIAQEFSRFLAKGLPGETDVYIDNILTFGNARQVRTAYQMLIQRCTAMGVSLSEKIDPATVMTHRGLIFDVASKRIKTCERFIAKLRQRKPRTWAEWRIIIGMMIYGLQSLDLPLTKIRWLLQWAGSHTLTYPGKFTTPMRSAFRQYQSVREELLRESWYPVIYQENNEIVIITDASGGDRAGWGCIMRIRERIMHKSGIFRKKDTIHILELRAIGIALRVWKHLIPQGMRIQVMCDNMAVVDVLRAGHAHDVKFAGELHVVLSLCASLGVRLRPTYIPSEMNPADPLSRGMGFARHWCGE